MKPVLWIALATSLGLSAWLALQPDAADDTSGLVVAPRQNGPSAPAPMARAGTRPGLQTTRGPNAASSAGAESALPAAATPPALPARAADWPAAPARALLAWGATPPPLPAATPPARPPIQLPPERPRAPAFPYQWIGTLDDGGGAQALLGGTVRGAAVRAGQVLDGQWRIERIREQQLELTWLPGEQAVTVRGGLLSAGAGRPALPARAAGESDNPEADPAPES